MSKDLRDEVRKVIRDLESCLASSEDRANERGEFFSGSVFGPEIVRRLKEVLDETVPEKRHDEFRTAYLLNKESKYVFLYECFDFAYIHIEAQDRMEAERLAIQHFNDRNIGRAWHGKDYELVRICALDGRCIWDNMSSSKMPIEFRIPEQDQEVV